MANEKFSQWSTNNSPATTDSILSIQSPGVTPQDVQVPVSKLMQPTLVTNPYKFRVYRAAAANTGNGVGATVIWDTKLYDTGSNYNTSTGNFTIPATGFYFFSYQVAASTASSSQTVLASIWQNGVLQAQGSRTLSPAAAFLASNGSILLSCTTNDTIQIQAYGSATFALAVNTVYDMFFTGFMVSAL